MGVRKVEVYYTCPGSVILPSSRHLSIVSYTHYYSCAVLSFFTLVKLLVQSSSPYTDQRPKQNFSVKLITMHLTQLLLLASATLTVATPYHSWKHEHSWDGEDDCTAEDESPSSTFQAGLSPPGSTAPGGYEAPTSVSSGPTAIVPSQSAVQPVGPATAASSPASPASSSAAAPIQSPVESASAAAPPSSSSSAASAPPPSSSALIATFTEYVLPLSIQLSSPKPLLPEPSSKSLTLKPPDTDPATPMAPQTATPPPPPAAFTPTPASTPPPPKPSTVPPRELAPAPPAACAINSPR